MNLTPSDLGESWEKRVLERRGVRLGPAPQPGLLEHARWVLAGLIPVELGLAIFRQDPGYIIGPGLITAAVLATPLLVRRREQQRREKSLTQAEIESLRPAPQRALDVPAPVAFLASLIGRPLPMPKVGDGLEEAFVSLAQQLRALDVSEESVASEFRRTLKALGDAVSDLPPPAELPDIDVADLVVDAETLLIRARRERDDVVAGSLQRQAEATVRRARATTEALKLARRTRTLRQEVLTQIEGCRAALPALARTSGVASGLGTGRFAALAEQVQGVAREAASVAAAQEELAQAVGSYVTTTAQPEQQTLRLGR
jgi:hypothetical protein